MYTQEEIDQLDTDALYNSPELLGHECDGCRKVLPFSYYDKNSAYRDGYEGLCTNCKVAPRLSIEEHCANLKELTFNSESVKKQRHEDQEEFKKHEARLGRPMHASEFLLRVQRLVPNLFVKEGGIVGYLGLYLVSDIPREDWKHKTFNYLGYIEFTLLPEFSRYEFNTERDIMIRESDRGWRTVLLRLFKAGALTEDQIAQEFGYAHGDGSNTWYKELQKQRTKNLLGDKL